MNSSVLWLSLTLTFYCQLLKYDFKKSSQCKLNFCFKLLLLLDISSLSVYFSQMRI